MKNRWLVTVLLGFACSRTVRAPDVWPADGCESDPPETDSTGIKSRALVLETDDVDLAMNVLWPKKGRCHGAVVMVPAGFEAASHPETQQVRVLAEAGLAVVLWDPRGRGDSTGQEDHNGAAGQDDLASVLRWTAGENRVDPDNVVVFSRSFGGALVAGALSRHSDLAPVEWLDLESPANMSEELELAPEFNQETFADILAEQDDEDSWWAAREPVGLIGDVAVSYHRLQGLPDHALGSYIAHARAMLDGAEMASQVRYNDAEVQTPIGEETARDLAVEGGIEWTSPWVSELILDAAGG